MAKQKRYFLFTRFHITRYLVPVSLYAVLLGVLLYPVWILGSQNLLFGDDIHRQYYFYRQFFSTFIQKGIFPWWNPYVFGGEPFIANPVVNIWYPVNWIFSILPLAKAYVFHIFFHLLSAMTGMYMLSSKFLSERLETGKVQSSKLEDNIGPWISGFVFGLSGFFMARTWAGHVDVIASASYMPWVFGLFWKAMQKPTVRAYIWAGSVFALQLYAGYQTMAFFTIEAVGIAMIYCMVTTKSIRPLVSCLTSGVIGLGLAALQILPEQEFFRRSIRTFPLPYSWISYGSLKIESLKQLFFPFLFGNQHTYNGPPPNFVEHAMFIGVLSLVILIAFLGYIMIGILRRNKATGKDWIVFFAIGIFSLWVSLGNYAPVDLQYILWKFIPMYHYLRIPPRHLILFIFSSSVLVGLALKKIKHKSILWIIAGFIFIELFLFARGFIELQAIPETRHDRELISILTKDAEPFRLIQNFGVWVSPRDSLDFDSVMSYGIYSATGYDPSILRNYYEFIDAVNKNETSSVVNQDVQIPYLDLQSPYTDFLNIKYILVPRSADTVAQISGIRFRLLREDLRRDYRLYENTSVLPRFFLISNTVPYSTHEEGLKIIRSGNVDVSKTIIIKRELGQSNAIHSLPCPNGEQGDVRVISYTPNRIELGVESPCDGYLASSEIIYPGWEATIDGAKTTILEGNTVFRTLPILKGKHVVVYTYKPLIFLIGFLMSFSTLIGAILLLFFDKKRTAGLLR